MELKKRDRVKVVNYGHLIWKVIEGKIAWDDLSPELVGREGIITDILITQGKSGYKLALDNHHPHEKVCWYSESQLEIVER